MPKPNERSRGFTLLELLIAAIIGGVAIGGLYSFVGFGERTTKRSVVHADGAAAERVALGGLAQAFEQAETILYPPRGGAADHVVFRTRSGRHHGIELAPGRRHVLLTVIETGEHYVVATVGDTTVRFGRAAFFNTGQGIDVALFVRDDGASSTQLRSFALAGATAGGLP